MPEEKCENRRFFLDRQPSELVGSGSQAELYGYCRRHPPTVMQQYLGDGQASRASTAWPVVAKEDWCGDYYRMFHSKPSLA